MIAILDWKLSAPSCLKNMNRLKTEALPQHCLITTEIHVKGFPKL